MLQGGGLELLQRIGLPLLLLWGGARFIMGVSLVYLLHCVTLELLIKVLTTFADPAGVQPKASEIAPQLADEQKSLPLRGCKAVEGEVSLPKLQTQPSKRSSKASSEPPAGQQMEYGGSTSSTSRSFLHLGRKPKEETALGVVEDEAWLQRRRCLREGAEVHRQVRQHVQQKVRPGMELLEIAEMVEQASSSLVGFDPRNPLRRGWAFPTGLSLNEVAAHDTVNPGDPARWLQPADILKIDFGVHVQGNILDSAFSVSFDPMHDELMRTVQEATETGIRNAGPDAWISEISSQIREVMESGEVHRPDGKVFRVKVIKNLTGHLIGPYKIHAGKSLPSVNTGGRERMLAGELWAVETFGSVGGLGYVGNGGNCSHFMRSSGSEPAQWQRSILSSSAVNLLDLIDQRFGTLAFCPRWILQAAQQKKPKTATSDQRWWASPLDELCNVGVVNRFPPLADLRGSYTAQYEHTILLGSSRKEVLTRGDDY